MRNDEMGVGAGRRVRRWLVFSFLIATAVVTSSAKADLIVNGGFETGDTTGWTVINLEAPYSGVTQYDIWLGYIMPHGGSYYASLSDDHNARIISGYGRVAEFSQNVSTIPGQTYFLSFWVYVEPSALPGVVFQAYWDATLLLSINDPKDNLLAPQHIRDKWVNYNFTVTGSATGTNSVVFLGENDPRYNGLDDVSLRMLKSPFVPFVVSEPSPFPCRQCCSACSALSGRISG